jgi:DNA-binding response OmpR family regulator
MTRRVVIVAQDLIWADRLASSVRAADAHPVAAASLAQATAAFGSADAAIVDLTARSYDGLAAIAAAHAAGLPVLAVGQHDDHDLRKRALAAGAARVYAYRKLFDDGPAAIAAWLERAPVGGS